MPATHNLNTRFGELNLTTAAFNHVQDNGSDADLLAYWWLSIERNPITQKIGINDARQFNRPESQEQAVEALSRLSPDDSDSSAAEQTVNQLLDQASRDRLPHGVHGIILGDIQNHPRLTFVPLEFQKRMTDAIYEDDQRFNSRAHRSRVFQIILEVIMREARMMQNLAQTIGAVSQTEKNRANMIKGLDCSSLYEQMTPEYRKWVSRALSQERVIRVREIADRAGYRRVAHAIRTALNMGSVTELFEPEKFVSGRE